MIKNKLFWNLLCLVLLCGCKRNNIEFEIVKILTNYPEKELEWYNSPPEIELIFRLKNNSLHILKVPMYGNISSSTLECSDQKLTLNKTTSKETVYLEPNEENLFSLKTYFKEIRSVLKDCNYNNPGDFFNQLFKDLEVYILVESRQKASQNIGDVHNIPLNLKATKSINIKYSIPYESDLRLHQ